MSQTVLTASHRKHSCPTSTSLLLNIQCLHVYRAALMCVHPSSFSKHDGKNTFFTGITGWININHIQKTSEGKDEQRTYQPVPHRPSDCPPPHVAERRRRVIWNYSVSLVPAPRKESLRRTAPLPQATETGGQLI